MRYLGGKARIGKALSGVMLNDTVKRELYLEPFLGGCNVLPHMAPHFDMCVASDVVPDVALMWAEALAGWRPPDEISQATYNQLRNAEPSALRGFAGFGYSFGGKWFGGYAKESPGHYEPRVSQRALSRSIEPLSPDSTLILCRDYRSYIPPERAVVYCDPPYSGTTGYDGAPPWDSVEFWEVVTGWAHRGVSVYVSEYQAPDGWVEIWSHQKQRSLDTARTVGIDKATERLFAFRP